MTDPQNQLHAAESSTKDGGVHQGIRKLVQCFWRQSCESFGTFVGPEWISARNGPQNGEALGAVGELGWLCELA
jgi:hypothetical protein